MSEVIQTGTRLTPARVERPVTIDLSAVSDVIRDGDKFDVIAIDPGSDDATTAIVVREGTVITQERGPYRFEDHLAQNMGAFHKAAKALVDSGYVEEQRYRPVGPRTKKQLKARAASKAQKKARKAQRRK